MREPGLADRLEAGQPGLGPGGGLPDLVAEDLLRRLERGQLNLLLAAERSDHARLAHLEPAGKAADRHRLEAFERGLANGGVDDP